MNRFLYSFRPVVSCAAALALVVAQVAPAFAASAMSRAEYEACQARDEVGFRLAVETLTRRSLETALANLDYKPLVADEWRRGNLDDVVDREVDRAVAEVREESSWFQLWSTLASREKAQALATTTAERVYRSDAMKNALEGLAAGLGKEIGKRIEIATIDTAGSATQCMEAFLGRRYGSMVARVVAEGAGKEYAIDPAKGSAHVSTGMVLAEGTEGLAGAVVLVVRRQLSRMAARIGQRVIGSILSRLVSVVAGGVGLVLIAKDVWDFRHGVLPIISDEMKSRATKDKVRDELASSIAEQIGEGLKEIAEQTSQRVMEVWLDFRRAHAKVLEFAENNDAFRRFLDSIKASDLPRLDEVVGLVLASEGEAAIPQRLADGSLHQAVTTLSPAALDIAREARSLAVALSWSAVAGDSLPRVVEFGIHRRAKPEAFTRASLDRLFALGDRLATVRLASLQPSARDALFELDSAELKALARALDEPQLDSLSRYLTGLERISAQRLLRAVAHAPARMAELASPGVREAILASRDQAAAVGMMLQANSVPAPMQVWEHTQLVVDGRISPWLLWAKYPVALVAAAVSALLLLLMLKRLMFGSRPRVVVQQAGYSGRDRGGRR